MDVCEWCGLACMMYEPLKARHVCLFERLRPEMHMVGAAIVSLFASFKMLGGGWRVCP
jgi:hypothetical protein